MDSEKGTAYHEAGHGVVAIVMGLDPVSLSVEANGDSYGRVMYPAVESRMTDARFDDTDPENVEWLHSHLVTALAGWWAEKLALREADNERARQDRENAAEIARRLGGDGPRAAQIADDAVREANQLLRDNWQAVEAVADALLERGTLTGKEARMLMQR